jgi:hypothetical protein
VVKWMGVETCKVCEKLYKHRYTELLLTKIVSHSRISCWLECGRTLWYTVRWRKESGERMDAGLMTTMMVVKRVNCQFTELDVRS